MLNTTRTDGAHEPRSQPAKSQGQRLSPVPFYLTRRGERINCFRPFALGSVQLAQLEVKQSAAVAKDAERLAPHVCQIVAPLDLVEDAQLTPMRVNLVARQSIRTAAILQQHLPLVRQSRAG